MSLDPRFGLLAGAEGTALRNMRTSHMAISLRILSNVPRNSVILASNRPAMAVNNSTLSPPGCVGQSYRVRWTDISKVSKWTDQTLRRSSHDSSRKNHRVRVPENIHKEKKLELFHMEKEIG